MRVHFTGVCGTGMGQLALLFREAGHTVDGSDRAFDPPIGPQLREAGLSLKEGYEASHLTEGAGEPDLVVIGNAIRADNPEAVAARERGLAVTSMSGALRTSFLAGRRAVVITGTHGKTTTSSLAAFVLETADLKPGFFIGGIPKDFGTGGRIGRKGQALLGPRNEPVGAPFVVEGDEYDAVYWHKKPKFLDYVGASGPAGKDVVVLTSIEHDHVDIYPDEASYLAAFEALVAAIPAGGLLVANAADRHVRELAKKATCTVAWYALQGDDTGDVNPEWLAAPAHVDERGVTFFDLFAGGVSAGRFQQSIPGRHNIANATAVVAVAAQGFGVSFATIRKGLGTFTGVKRRQDLLGTPNGIAVYDDFAHHPTAVDETLRALRSKASSPSARLFAVFEPRSATACRNTHQAEYPKVFGAADRVILATLGRTNIPESERLDLVKIAAELPTGKAVAAPSIDAILDLLVAEAKPGDAIALLANGAFGGVHPQLLARLSTS